MRRLIGFQTSLTIGRVLGAAVALAGVAACSSGSPSPLAAASGQAGAQASYRSSGPSTRVRFDGGHCPASVVYVVSSQTSSIKIYDRTQLQAGPCGSITGLVSPQGLFVDSKGSLWVADASAQEVFQFAAGTQAPVLTLNDPNGVPYDVAVDETSGTVYVTEYQNHVNPNTLVEVYAKGSTRPTGSLSDPEARNGGYDAVDNQGNLYVTFMTQSNTAQVDRWSGGTGSPQNLGLELVSDGGIVTTASGALAVCDPFAFRCGVFEQGSTKLSHVFGHMGRSASGPNPDKPPWLHPDALALDRAEHLAYVAAESLTAWRFPGPDHRQNHLPLTQINVPGGAGQGIAVSPASLPGAPF
jgi:hypothetical protein